MDIITLAWTALKEVFTFFLSIVVRGRSGLYDLALLIA